MIFEGWGGFVIGEGTKRFAGSFWGVCNGGGHKWMDSEYYRSCAGLEERRWAVFFFLFGGCSYQLRYRNSIFLT